MSHERFDRKVDGMICPQCEDEIAHSLLHTRGILSCTASYRKSTGAPTGSRSCSSRACILPSPP